MRTYQKVLAVIALSGMCLAAPLPSSSDPASKKHTKHHAVKPVKKDLNAEKLRELKETVDAQQAAMQQLQQQVQQTQQQLQQTQQQLTQTQQTAQAADAKATAVETNTNLQVQRVQSDLTDVKTALNTTEVTVAKDDKLVTELGHPNSIAYKGIRITPGGFIEATGYYRSHATLSDQSTAINAIPVANQPNTKLTEIGITARDSRLSLRADADAGKTKITGYFETDFFGTSPTSNYNQSTSYTLRIRQAWGRAKFGNGWTVTGGQMWNLITMNRKGVDADVNTLWIPNTLEAQYQVGWNWGRFGELRIAKTSKNLSMALGIVNPSYLNSGVNQNSVGVSGLTGLGAANDGNSVVTACTSTVPVTCTNTPTYTTPLAPDLVAKIAFDSAHLGHFEVRGVGRFFRDRVQGTKTTPGHENVALGYGVGAGMIIPILPKKVDFIASGMAGRGISRYADSGNTDFVVTPGDFQMLPVKTVSFVTGIETHLTKKFEADVLFGDEYYQRTTYKTGATTFGGYGASTADNRGCFYETAVQVPTTTPATSTACAPSNRNLAHVAFVAYYDLYKGSYGTLRYGAEYEYIDRRTWSGNAGGNAVVGQRAPKGVENGIFTTMRYIFP